MTEKTYTLTPQQAAEAFINANLEDEFNFLQDDLMKLSQAFIDAAKPGLIRDEQEECVKFVRSLNSYVAEKLKEYRGLK